MPVTDKNSSFSWVTCSSSENARAQLANDRFSLLQFTAKQVTLAMRFGLVAAFFFAIGCGRGRGEKRASLITSSSDRSALMEDTFLQHGEDWLNRPPPDFALGKKELCVLIFTR